MIACGPSSNGKAAEIRRWCGGQKTNGTRQKCPADSEKWEKAVSGLRVKGDSSND
jgi:hypothetical protein